MRTPLALLVLAGSIASFPSTLVAQPLDHHPPQWIIPPAPRRMPPPAVHEVNLSAVNVTVEITDQVATTTLDLALTNPADRPLEAQLILPVPDGVAVRSLQWDGTGPEPKAEVLPRDEARRIYEGIVRSMRDPALVEFVGLNLIRSSVFPVPPRSTQHLRLTYEQVLPRDGNRLDYALVRGEALAEAGVPWTFAADLKSKHPIATVYSPSHDITQERLGPGHVRVKLASTNADPSRGSIRLAAVLEDAPGTLATSIFTYPSTDPKDPGGYFMILAAPPVDSRSRPPTPREVVLVLDRSGSMRGEKFEQARNAAIQVVRGLRDGESFNIIDYSDSIASFAPTPVVKDAKNARDAEAYLAGLAPNGGTNIHDAVLEALRPAPADGAMPMVLFLTDGLPTVGERREVRLRDAIAATNATHRRIFSFGVGLDVNAPLLSAISQKSRGATTWVLPQEDIEVKVSQVFRRLDGPVMTFPVLAAFGPDGQPSSRVIRDQMPADLPDIFEGDQIIILGRYHADQPVKTRLEGSFFGQPRAFDVTIDPAASTTRHSFVPRLWAMRKVSALVDEVRQAGADGSQPSEGRLKEITDEIIRLSTTWGILTEYTAFLSREDADFSRGLSALNAPARENLRDTAIRLRSGAGGAAQQLDIEAKQAAANTQTANRYVGRAPAVAGQEARVEAYTVAAVQNVADKTLYNRKQRWVDASILEQENENPDRVVEFGTDAYFALAAQLARENRQSLLANRGEIYLLVEKERVLIKGP
ncbi:MAG: hypothetical protein HBSAPP03_23840 [Phycisphaerae bacterium]|nr:MAG: hypothetical protein HBSAPP03_23840 [Phycisphaerae bacterium]